MVRDILLLGNPGLRVRCTSLREFDTPALHSLVADLRDTLYDFRHHNGFGRGIAAPQIGSTLRVIFLHVDAPVAMINPVIAYRSRKTFALWDDCFSFPNLLVKVRRHSQVEVRYRDVQGKRCRLEAQDGLAELLQHEIDHLDGILAIDRAIDSKHIILRSEFERMKR